MVLKVYRFQHRRNCCIGKTKTNKMVFSTVEKGYDNWWMIKLLYLNVHKSVLSRKLVFWMSNWKRVIKHIQFPRIFAHSVHICAKFYCKNFKDVCQVFLILHHYTWGGPFFMDMLYRHLIKTKIFNVAWSILHVPVQQFSCKISGLCY